MRVEYTPTIVPFGITMRLEVDEADIIKAFVEAADPDETLFYTLFSPAWSRLTTTEKMEALTALARDVEPDRAVALKTTASAPQPK